jgi:tetratricopeptide (TPR) repeat protein
MGGIWFEYLRLLLWPATLQIDAYYLARPGVVNSPTLAAGLGWAAMAALVTAALALAVGIRHSTAADPGSRWADGAPMPRPLQARSAGLVGVAIFLSFLAPVSHLLPMGSLMAERLLFAPSLGAALALAASLRACRGLLPAGARPGAVAAAALLVGGATILGGWRSHSRALEWRNPVLLWRSADRAIGNDPRVKSNLAAELILEGDLDEAEAVLTEALLIRPDPAALYNLAVIAANRGDLDTALSRYEDLLLKYPGNVDALVGLARVEAVLGNRETARRLAAEARQLSPGRGDIEALQSELLR